MKLQFRVCMGVVFGSMLLMACAKIDDRAMSLVGTSADAILLINGRVLAGTLQLRTDRTGTLAVAEPELVPQDAGSGAVAPDASTARLSCTGRYRFTATTAGSVDLRCTEGTASELNIALLSETRGYGYGQTPFGTVSLTFGLSPQAAKAYLVVPVGKRLQEISDAPFFQVQ